MGSLARLADVGKQYVKYEDVPTLVTGVRQMLRKGRRGRLWAVRHFDLELDRGESVAVIGRNGSGKSTTLSMLAGVTAPTEGVVQVNGRIAPLLRLGVGFDPELTGRENVFINGMILGMTNKEVERRFDGIVEFAELEEFIDTPVKFYSSGMMVRLGFASAVAAEPDLLIVDEVLAVGDVAFQMRSFDRMLEMQQNGAALVVVSHNMSAVRRLATRAVVLHDGQVSFRGSTPDSISHYHDLQRESTRRTTPLAEEGETVRILSFDMYGADGEPTANVEEGETVTLRARIRFLADAEDVLFGISITTETSQVVYSENSIGGAGHLSFRAGDEQTFVARVPMHLVSGSYTAAGGVIWGSVVRDRALATPKIFYVSGRPLIRGVADLHAQFDLEDDPPA
jgi:lipopolysaccharide transport system ATP-binding protein